jgi:hypothetical protein
LLDTNEFQSREAKILFSSSISVTNLGSGAEKLTGDDTGVKVAGHYG